MFRPARLPCLSTAGPRPSFTSFVALPGRRHYAVSIRPSTVWPGKREPRVFSEHKTYLFNQFTSLLNRSSSRPVLFLHHKNFKADALIKLRREITATALPKGAKQLSLLQVAPDPETLPQLAVIQSSIFGVTLRNFAPLDSETIQRIASMAHGGALAVITLPSLDPPMLRDILRTLEHAIPPKKQEEEQPKKKGKGKDGDEEKFVPGRRQKRQKPMLDPELSVAGALIEGRVFGVEQVKDVSKLPTLDMLRQQIVGLISSPAVQLAMVLGEASGGRLARTLDGFKKALEDGQTTKEETTSGP
ncbi:hypothetical protein ACEPAI_255 [Sanghuangporus weigelae]